MLSISIQTHRPMTNWKKWSLFKDAEINIYNCLPVSNSYAWFKFIFFSAEALSSTN